MTRLSSLLSIRFLGIASLSIALWSSPIGTIHAMEDPKQAPTSDIQNQLLVVWDTPLPPSKTKMKVLSGVSSKKRSTPYVSLIEAKSLKEYEQLLQELGNNPNVLSVEPNQERHLPDIKSSALVNDNDPEARRVASAVAPNDTHFDEQWAFSTMHVTEAWELLQPAKKTVKVAVIDSGVDISHPDLQANLLPGKDYIHNDSTPEDENGHGTHVSGIIAAQSNNQKGIAGLNGLIDVKILPLKILDAEGSGSVAAEVAAIYDAVSMGADIINLSLGGEDYTKSEADAIRFATQNGVIVVAATGNEYTSVNYPAALSDVIAVGATTPLDKVAYFSNFGSQVDVAAPGVDIVSTVPLTIEENGYEFFSGTSMATPQVSALVALMRSQVPHLTKAKVTEILNNTSVDIGRKGKDNYSGYGRIDFLQAIQKLQELYPPDNYSTTYSLAELKEDPKAFHDLLLTHESNELQVTTADGRAYTWEELISQPALLEQVMKQEGSKLSIHTDPASPSAFITSMNLEWGTTNVDLYPSLTVSLDATIDTKALKILDRRGRRVTGVDVVKSTNNRYYIEMNRSFVPNHTYRLVYANSITLAQFTTSSQKVDVGARVVKRYGAKNQIPVQQLFDLRFASSLIIGTLTSENAWIVDNLGKTVAADIQLSDDKKIITIQPNAELERGSIYFLVLKEDHRNGNATLVPFRTVHE